MEKRYFHYTPEIRLNEIIESGKIKLADTSIIKREKACAWISTNPNWEHTATKRIFINGCFESLTFEEQVEYFGCARIQVEPMGLYKWNKLKHKLKMEKNIAYALEMEGLEMGGHPSDWYGSLYPIGINRWIKAEVYRNGQWIDYRIFNIKN